MKIQSLELKNFRCFKDVTIDFHKQLTVLVGVNGSGKTAVLEAVSMILEDILRYALPEALPSFKYESSYLLSHEDTSYNANSSAALHANFEMQGKHYKWIDPLVEAQEQSSANDNVNVTIINVKRGANSNYQLVEKIKEINFYIPVMSYYSVYRLLLNAYPSAAHLYERKWLDAYENCFAALIDLEKALTWFKGEEFRVLTGLRDGKKENANELESVREAVAKALPEYNNVRCINNPPEVVLTRKCDEQTIPFGQLSGGYRAMLALIFDLARRMAVANGKSESFAKSGLPSLLHSPAIVLIDEVELHLHPSWQQTVLPSLMDIFPNTQFIVTTHSPQVLTSIPSECIRILEDGKASHIQHGTLGAESSRVLEDVFTVPSRPEWLTIPTSTGTESYPLKEKISQYFKLISDDLYDSKEATAIRSELERFLPDDPMLVRAAAQIERARRLKARRESHA